MSWSIAQVARISTVTSRTLRHYDEIGLLKPARVGGNGYRYYEREQLLRLQQILLLRDLGLGLTQIGQVLDNGERPVDALRSHLQQSAGGAGSPRDARPDGVAHHRGPGGR